MKKKPIIIKSLASLNKKNNNSIPDDLLDKWVNKESEDNVNNPKKITTILEETRLTILIPTYLHRRIKKFCASHSLSMKEKIIEVFKENFPET